MPPRSRSKRQIACRAGGYGLMEAVTGSLILIPLVLLGVDAMAALNVSHSNQELAQRVARAAANNVNEGDARQVAQQTVSSFQPTKLISDVTLSEFVFDTQSKVVTVSTVMKVLMPIPLPGTSDLKMTARCSEPIVAIPPKV